MSLLVVGWVGVALFAVLAAMHQRRESREGIAAYLFGDERPRWLDTALALGAYGAVTMFLAFQTLWSFGHATLALCSLQIAAGLYIGDGLVTHAARWAPAHEDFGWLTLTGFVLLMGAGSLAGHIPWLAAVGLGVFIVLRVVAARYKAEHTGVGR